jgi:ribosomal protein L11 methyltransferase
MTYEDLYVYWIEGVVPPDEEARLGHAFIGNWVEDKSSFLFFQEPSQDGVLECVKRNQGLTFSEAYHFTYEQWQGGVLEPFRIGPLLIVPPWKDIPEKRDEKKILLDPGVVFGTGLHPTTKDCLKAIVYLDRAHSLDRVLDIGTGTGVLSLAAVKLGAKQAWAVDLNPLAVKTARRNVALNEMEEQIQVLESDATKVLDRTADLVVANIHEEVILGLLAEEMFLRNRWYILSGLMRSQAIRVRDALKSKHMMVIREWDFDMTWYTLLAGNSYF